MCKFNEEATTQADIKLCFAMKRRYRVATKTEARRWIYLCTWYLKDLCSDMVSSSGVHILKEWFWKTEQKAETNKTSERRSVLWQNAQTQSVQSIKKMCERCTHHSLLIPPLEGNTWQDITITCV